MDDITSTARRARRRKGQIAGAAGLVAAGALAGGVRAGTLSATAAGSGASSSSSAKPKAPWSAPRWHDGFRGFPGGPGSMRPDEKQLTGADADKARAAALKAVPGGTVYRVESDAGDAAYEAHMTKADGTPVTVKLDKSLSVIKVESGVGAGDPRPNGAWPGGQPGSATGSGTGA